MLRVGIVGGSGYAGVELLRLLAMHPEAKVVAVSSRTHAGKPIWAVLPGLRGCYDLVFGEYTTAELAAMCDVVFTATPHGVALDMAEDILAGGCKLIDMGADFRLRDGAIYESWYKHAPAKPELLAEAVYGLPELHRADIAKARVVGVPGCYPTSTILACVPVLKAGLAKPGVVVVDSKSGTSGAGSTPTQTSHFAECTENFRAYGVAGHRHTPEMEQELSLATGSDVLVSFTPHLVPMARGIFTTVHLLAAAGVATEDVVEAYARDYANEPFIRVLGAEELPQTKAVMGSNFVELAARVDKRTGSLILLSAIDNMGKGASGQGIQCMNIMFGLGETTGLGMPGMLP